ncbi:general secretion pathway protein GspL [Luteimonas viscosa]|uniref:General secretion pathway protein GspL n=1 Tax=Luteimonas viscosa TaxID=1132694 RepID=A0A5D4XEK0_9GAMM|nr:PilN domain-containing protein [Luteimonas viscosa]TYT22977.1 general secretion pathway protein GspL [Luteimonas viscosa]
MMAVVEQSGTASSGLRGGFRRVEGSLRPRLRDFRAWWTRSLASWLPARLRDLFGLSPQRLLLRRSGSGLELSLWRGEGVRLLADVPMPEPASGEGDPLAALLSPRMAEVPRWLVLPASAVLRRRLTLPAAAGERLREVLGFEIDRQTPFTTAEVSYDARVLGHRGDDQLEAELVVVPKARLDAALEGLGPLAPTLVGVDAADATGEPLGVNLMGGAQRRRRDDPWRRRNAVMLLVAAAALSAGMWQMLANREAAAEVFAQQVDEAVRQARAASLQKRQLVDLVEGGAFLQATRAGRPTMVEVMDELARRLPDGTYLEKLSVEGDRVLLIGLSNEASALVGRLQGSPLWTSPALAGALQPDPRTRMDRFTLTATLTTASTAVTDARGGTATAEAADAAGAR